MNEILTTKYYKLLEIVFENLLVIDEEECCTLTQAELSKLLGTSRLVTNKIIKELVSIGYIIRKRKSRIQLSNTAYNIIDKTRFL